MKKMLFNLPVQMMRASSVYSLKARLVVFVCKLVCKFVSLFCNDDVLHFNLEKSLSRIQIYSLMTMLQHREHFFPSNRPFFQCS